MAHNAAHKPDDRASMTVLGIESSCDETAAAIVTRHWDAELQAYSGDVLANVVRSQIDEHKEFGGVVPEIAARAHVELMDEIIARAMEEAGLVQETDGGQMRPDFAALDAIAVTAGPGLIGGLLVGMASAKALALVHNKPLIAVNHLEAHALTVGLTEAMRPPYLLLLISGGHSQLLIVEDIGRYRRLGTTVDDALGEAFDKTAKLLGLGYPGGPEVARWAQSGDGARFHLPRPMKGRDEPHFSFSGLKTALRQQAEALSPLSDQDIADLCASFETAICDTVIDRTARAMGLYVDLYENTDLHEAKQSGFKKLVVAGGVAANQTLRAGLNRLCDEEGFSLHVPPPVLCTDNGAMIAWAGAEIYARGQSDALDTGVKARWPLDPDAPPAYGAGVKA